MKDKPTFTDNQQERDYLIGKILRLAENAGEYDEALETLKTHHSIRYLQDWCEELEYELGDPEEYEYYCPY